ncbi:hypothetical protein H4582DRAFT_2142343 [Lactarius indigo]|nr:hypothetical protein H4582DRAFT_2142343 [Lactarius indigo]
MDVIRRQHPVIPAVRSTIMTELTCEAECLISQINKSTAAPQERTSRASRPEGGMGVCKDSPNVAPTELPVAQEAGKVVLPFEYCRSRQRSGVQLPSAGNGGHRYFVVVLYSRLEAIHRGTQQGGNTLNQSASAREMMVWCYARSTYPANSATGIPKLDQFRPAVLQRNLIPGSPIHWLRRGRDHAGQIYDRCVVLDPCGEPQGRLAEGLVQDKLSPAASKRCDGTEQLPGLMRVGDVSFVSAGLPALEARKGDRRADVATTKEKPNPPDDLIPREYD